MTGSWQRINYGLRPAKNVERKLMAEGLGRLDRLRPLQEFRYIGMGSLYFTDFALFHRRLGVVDMHSIEAGAETDIQLQLRFEANRPFFTTLHFEHTSVALPRLLRPGEPPAIVWLDYDNPIDSQILNDLALVLSSAAAPTVLAVSVNVEPGGAAGRRERLIQAVGEDLVPPDVLKDVDLSQDKMRRVTHKILSSRAAVAVRDRNRAAGRNEQLGLRQIFHFAYQDGARMLTTAWVMYPNVLRGRLDGCGLHSLTYYRDATNPFRIVVPLLTTREAFALDAQLPANDPPRLPGVSEVDCSSYAQLYRYLPSYVDADL